jgi:uncharacterized protein YkuJ
MNKINMKVIFLSSILVFIFVFVAAAQKIPAKRETERDQRELVGPVHYVRIRRELNRSTDGKGFEGGWIPSLTVYNRNGAIKEFFAYDDKGNLDYKSVGKFASSGNKIEEDTYRTGEKLPRKKLMAYNPGGNIIENKDYNNYDGSMSEWQRFSYNRKGYVKSISYLSKDGRLLAVGKYLYNQAGKQRQWSSFDKSGKLLAKSLYYYHKNNEEIRTYDNQGTLTARSITLVDDKGNQTEINYGKNGKPWNKARYSYKRDAHGNWIKEVCSEWEDKDGHLIFKRTKVTRRTIIYY